MDKEKKIGATIRMKESHLEAIDTIAKRTKQDRSEVLRVAVKRFLDINDNLKEGKTMLFLPALNDLKKYQSSLTEFEELFKEDLSEETKLIMSSVIEALELKILMELHKKYPNEKGFYKLK